MIKRIRNLMTKFRTSSEFLFYVDELRERFKAKRNFMTLPDTL